jgi:hypothetical protein
MDAIRQYLKDPRIAGLVGFVVGAIVGLVILGWWLFPVKWTDAAPVHLRADLQEDYLRMAIDSFNLSLDVEAAQRRWQELGPQAMDVLEQIEASPGMQSPAAIIAFRAAVGAEEGAITTQVPPTKTRGVLGWLPWLLGITLLFGAALLWRISQRKGISPPVGVGGPVEEEMAPGTSDTFLSESVYELAEEEPPLSQFMTTYNLGDDLFDNSFSIDSPAGEFLGECGVGISETIGVGDPKKVTAFEIWLFDKNDIQTVTKVLMSAHAFQDETIRQRLANKGEPILAEPGREIVLETATLQLLARITDMHYGEGALPPESFMDRLTLELNVWQKPPGTTV